MRGNAIPAIVTVSTCSCGAIASRPSPSRMSMVAACSGESKRRTVACAASTEARLMSDAMSRCARPESTRATPSAPFSQPMSAATATGRTMSWIT